MRKELESYLDDLAPLARPLPKTGDSWRMSEPGDSQKIEVQPLFVACVEGLLDNDKRWAPGRREIPRQTGLQDGLA